MTTSQSTPTILVHEWVTGGGMAGSPLPSSWAAEGRAIRRAIASDFAARNGGRGRVVVTLDSRLADDPGPWTVVPVGEGGLAERLDELARGTDFTVLIAPETMGVLEGLTRRLESTGTRLLGSSAGAVALAGDKAALARHLTALGIDTPPCRIVQPREGLPPDMVYPAVLKPCDGAGSLDTYFVEDHAKLSEPALSMERAILQPFVPGRPMSASFLVDVRGRARLIGIGEQQMTRRDGRFAYRGGRIPANVSVDHRPLRFAVESIPGLRGFVGIDFIRDEDRARTTIMEINPRPTTSIVGLTRLLPPGRLASAWIGACTADREGAAHLSGLAGLIRSQPPITFDASGSAPAAGGR